MAKKSNPLTVIDENYCQLRVDKCYTRKEAYLKATHKNHKTDGAIRNAAMVFHNRPHIKARIKQLQEENNEIRKESVRKAIKAIPYNKLQAFNDLQEIHKRCLEEGNLKTAVSALDSIIKLMGLAEETGDREIVFKILGGKEK